MNDSTTDDALSVSNEYKKKYISIVFSIRNEVEALVSSLFLDRIRKILENIKQFLFPALGENIKWVQSRIILSASTTHLFLALLLEKIKDVIEYRYTVSTNLLFERRINRWLNPDVFGVFIEQFKTIYVNFGSYHNFNNFQFEKVESQSLIENTLDLASDAEITIKDDAIKEWKIDYCLEELGKYIIEHETVNTKIQFNDVADYKNTFSSLIKEEAEYEQETARVQEKSKILFSCTIKSRENRRIMLIPYLKKSKIHVRFGDYVGIRGRNSWIASSTGHIVEIEDRSRRIYVDLHPDSKFPRDRTLCYLDLMWCCVPYTRMMASLAQFCENGF
ncbi:hypothetical protein RF11_08883 [Thelohanellus kitauei]|uniref:Uncharacterized protein n=1 Tax=Thelohanellus kitauei TaxID=669202 RepID=A0A0C2MPN9_THEKT|nr:hypothetical protein RF11_08883 [Thelohanellus kitauei]